MFQTLLYVLGPFLLQAGIGAAALYVALSFVGRVLIPRARLANAQRKVTEDYIAAAEARNALTCDLLVHVHTNALLADALPSHLRDALHALPPIPHRKSLT